MSSVPLLNPYCVLGRLDGGWRILFVGLGQRSFLADCLPMSRLWLGGRDLPDAA